MGASGKNFDTEAKKKDYYSVLSVLKKHKPDLQAVDKFGRNCLHHAGAAANVHGMQFTVVYIDHINKKKTGDTFAGKFM